MSTEDKTLFCKIIDREIPADIVYEDDKCIVIKDINPKAKVHLLIIPKKPIPTLFELTPEDKDCMGHMMLLLPQLAQSQGLEGFKTQINTGESGGQEVFHIHIHLMGNK
ncbi:histidine triad nucleotide-binding protein [Thiomicrorhabdus immobilis]|uniref:Histidine triad nucleotide-binding protein n=1 Tax=Thiomicrorhabdus immobilis TaxID=2791037 RepID=A0ABM7MAT6_9GAMM|nr:histidine triad nucleotide-binding protein [Thiomicrorhabdus immobilis]BCN92406.1 histidine triad nucleotide-binding protein [Thiomicrorhabdus immobilis]